ncbi:serine hydrolase [Escherichia coli]|uniref:serine hydrolase n=1 Tax=Escherichia coli TaxID=562 RepID=UPI003B5CBA3C
MERYFQRCSRVGQTNTGRCAAPPGCSRGRALVVIDGNQRVFRSYGETRPGNNVRPQLDSVIRIASLTKLMTSEMLVKLLDQGTVKLNDPLSKYAPPGARVPTYNGTPITLVNLATHTSAIPVAPLP